MLIVFFLLQLIADYSSPQEIPQKSLINCRASLATVTNGFPTQKFINVAKKYIELAMKFGPSENSSSENKNSREYYEEFEMKEKELKNLLDELRGKFFQLKEKQQTMILEVFKAGIETDSPLVANMFMSELMDMAGAIVAYSYGGNEGRQVPDNVRFVRDAMNNIFGHDFIPGSAASGSLPRRTSYVIKD